MEGNEVEKEITVLPTPHDWRTNLFVVTNKRNYTFLLTLGEGAAGQRRNTFRLTFNYPKELTQEQKRLSESQQKAALARRLAAPPVVKNNNYVMQVGRKSRAIAPIAAFDDGTFTYLTFPEKAKSPPSLLLRRMVAKPWLTPILTHSGLIRWLCSV
ncbi:TrbG/VirB9 family P-type conjugative transfer protein [Plesiomonas shigelloides subsp. oncorhynchi]|nr:TrbG/VirB9 family P-type conjugative transfer protein [Plesiomonas shigelloides]